MQLCSLLRNVFQPGTLHTARESICSLFIQHYLSARLLARWHVRFELNRYISSAQAALSPSAICVLSLSSRVGVVSYFALCTEFETWWDAVLLEIISVLCGQRRRSANLLLHRWFFPSPSMNGFWISIERDCCRVDEMLFGIILMWSLSDLSSAFYCRFRSHLSLPMVRPHSQYA